MALCPAGAGATAFHSFIETFGSSSQPNFTDARGVAVDQGSGDVYVMDAGSPPSIKRYHPDGTPDDFSALGSNSIDGKEGADATPGDEGLGFSSPSESQIAVDNSGGGTDGDIYVTQGSSSSPNAVNIFSSTGAYLGRLTAAGATNFTEACGVAVDPSGAVYVGDYGSGIHKFVPSANPPVNADHTATFTTTSNPCTLAAGAGATAGFLFPAEYNGPVSKIDSSTGELKYSFSSGVTTVSVDPGTGNVYAVKGGEFIEFDATGASSATRLSADALESNGLGLAVRSSTGNVYVSRVGAANLEVFGPLTIVPTVSPQPPTGFSSSEATLNGTVNPEGFAITECKFEYGLASQAGYPNSVPCEQAVPTDSSDHMVSANITGVSNGGTRYRFRLVAKNANGSSASDPELFRVGAAINGTAATVGSEEAILRGAIIPGSDATQVHFEWGATESYGNTTPTTNLSPGNEAVAVEGQLSGLTPGQTYHYRLLATNATGTTTGPDETFRASMPPQPLPERGYEIASQYPTGGVPIDEQLGGETASEDGNSIAVSPTTPLAHSTLPPLPDDPGSELIGGAVQYVFARGTDSWQHRTETGIGGEAWSSNLKRLLIVTETEVLGSGTVYEDSRVDPDDQNYPSGSFRGASDLYQWQPDGKLTWISRDPRIPSGTPQTAPGAAELADPMGSFTMSADGRTVVFKSERQLLDADTTPVNHFGQRPFRLYKWADGQLSFIGERPDGSVPAEGSVLGDYNTELSSRYAVSRDGSRVVFSARRHDGSSGLGIYVQTDGQPTVEATKEEGVPPLPAAQPYNVTYRGAAADDSRVFFTSASRLTPDSGGGATSTGATDLYVYDTAADKLRDLTPRLDDLPDPATAPAVADQARVLGVAANSEDGKRVYFVAEGQLPSAPSPAGELPQAASPNLYMAELDAIDGPIRVRFIGTLGTEDDLDWSSAWTGKTSLASPDGSVLGFASHESLTGQPLGGTQQLFVYDTANGRLDCASCPSDGSLPVDDVNKYLRAASTFGENWQGRNGVRRWVSSDGAAFFSTKTALLPADQNQVSDVYEFREGQLGLITTGTGTTESVFSNAGVDGTTVFIDTREALAPQDKEPGIPKIYAARIGGGYPYVPPEASCDINAGACEGATSKAAQTPGAGTAAFDGPGNPKPTTNRGCPRGKRKVRRQGAVRCVKKRHGRGHHKRNANHHRRAGR